MRKFKNLLFLFGTLLFFAGCEKKIDTNPQEMHWDRDMCTRCKMAISDRKFAAQVINPENGRVYRFDDIGCAVLWFHENQFPWEPKAVIWVTDAKTGEWIDARKADYTADSITPMGYGLAAHKKGTAPQDKEVVNFEEAKRRIFEVEKMDIVQRARIGQ